MAFSIEGCDESLTKNAICLPFISPYIVYFHIKRLAANKMEKWVCQTVAKHLKDSNTLQMK